MNARRAKSSCSPAPKPGSGASTLAMQTAYALRRASGKRVLLADFDLMAGSLGFYLKLDHAYSLVDLIQQRRSHRLRSMVDRDG